MKQKFNIKNWLYKILTHQVIPQERDLHWKLSHYSTKIIIIALVFKIVTPVLSTDIANAGEEIEKGKVLGASDIRMVYPVARPIDGDFDMSSLDSINQSMVNVSNTTKIYLDKITKSIDGLHNNIEGINEEIRKTEEEIESIKASILEILLDMNDIEDTDLLMQLLNGNKFSEIQNIIGQNEIVFSHFNEVLKSLKLKESKLRDLRDEASSENFVLEGRIEEKDSQNIQLEAINKGAEFFSKMSEEDYTKFIEEEKKAHQIFIGNDKEDEKLNMDIYNKAIEDNKSHFENLSLEEEKKAEVLENEADYLENEENNVEEDDLNNLLEYLSYGKINQSTNITEYIAKLELIPMASAISAEKLEKIKKILKVSKKLNSSEKNMVSRLKTEADIKKLLIKVITRLKKEKEEEVAQAKSVSAAAKNKANSFNKSGDSSYGHPLKVNPLFITATYGDKDYERIVGMFHNGVDMGIPQKTPVYAVEGGVVKSVVIDGTPSLAYLIIIHGDQKKMSAYLHMSKISVKEDDIIKKGQLIGYSGGTPGTTGAGYSSGPHLHFEIREMTNDRINPYPKYVPSNPPKVEYL